MIEQIATILREASASKMQLMIAPNADGTITVVINTSLQPVNAKESEAALNLRAALSAPLVIREQPNIIDVGITDALTHFTENYIQGVRVHSSLLDNKANIELATKKASASHSTSKTNVADDVESEENDEAVDVNTVSTSNDLSPPEKGVSSPSASTQPDFMNEEPDSL